MRTFRREQTLVRILFGESDKWHHQYLDGALFGSLIDGDTRVAFR